MQDSFSVIEIKVGTNAIRPLESGRHQAEFRAAKFRPETLNRRPLFEAERLLGPAGQSLSKRPKELIHGPRGFGHVDNSPRRKRRALVLNQEFVPPRVKPGDKQKGKGRDDG